jgi:protein tyrosine/serine phosphatase
VIQTILNGDNVYFHCRVGADRTGTLAYILEGLLGVSDEDRKQDYELTTLFGLADRTRYYEQKNSSSQSNKTHKFVYMTDASRIPTTESIYNWFTDNGTNSTAVQLVDDFRTAMIDYN